jgi:hypothetical protein
MRNPWTLWHSKRTPSGIDAPGHRAVSSNEDNPQETRRETRWRKNFQVGEREMYFMLALLMTSFFCLLAFVSRYKCKPPWFLANIFWNFSYHILSY